MTNPNTPHNRPEAENAPKGDRSGTCADGIGGWLSALFSDFDFTRLTRSVLFWAGEIIAALSLFIILFTLLFIGAVFQ